MKAVVSWPCLAAIGGISSLLAADQSAVPTQVHFHGKESSAPTPKSPANGDNSSRKILRFPAFAENMAEYVDQESLAWPMATDVDDMTVKSWNVRSYPTFFLIDRGGKVRFAGLYHDDVERAVTQLLDETARVPSGVTRSNSAQD